MIEMMTLVRGTEHGMNLFKEVLGWDVRASGNDFVNECCRCIDDPSQCSNQQLYTCFAKWIPFGEQLRIIDPRLAKRAMEKIRTDRTRAAMRGIMAETYVASRLTELGLEFEWEQGHALPDFEVRNSISSCCIEVTSVETKDPQLNYDAYLKRIIDKIRSKASKMYAGNNSCLVMDITSYSGKQQVVQSAPYIQSFAEKLKPAELGFGAIVLLTTVIRTRVELVPIVGIELPVEYRVVVGWNTLISQEATDGLQSILSMVFPWGSTQTQYFTEAPDF